MSTSTSKTVVVAGATGRFGGLVEVLLQRGHDVRALTRSPDGPQGERLRAVGADVAYGDFDDSGGIARAAEGADALFAAGTAHRAGPDGERLHGIAVADAAAAAGVQHFVYVSGDGASLDSRLLLFRAKPAVERHIAGVGVRHTILAPVYLS